MKKNELIRQLIKKHIYILSPHFDDAILSMGMLLYSLKEKAKIIVINVFTKSHDGPYTLSAKRYMKSSRFSNAKELYKKRAQEDKAALCLVKVKSINLNLVDGFFRVKKDKNFLGNFLPEINHIYPTYKFHLVRKISEKDYAPKELYKQLKTIISQNSLVFIPLGVGNHVDHMIVRQVGEKLFKNIMYYKDFPYSLHSDKYVVPTGYKLTKVQVDLLIKSNLIKQYISQINLLFEENIIPSHDEEFYTKKYLL